jgi:5-methyltetrahydrofolate--homocysteine methyltransferase
MSIDFSAERWRKLRETSRRWWNGELERPIVHAVLTGRDPKRQPSEIHFKRLTATFDFSIPAEKVVDAWDYQLSQREFLGDAYPVIWPDFGPGVCAVSMGAIGETSEKTVWFHPPREMEFADISPEVNLDHPWIRRISDILRAAMDRWNGQALVGMTDLGGNLDILSTFRPSEQLLLDLYDRPEDVKKAAWATHEAWWKCFEHFNAILQPKNPGYSHWAGIYCEKPTYMLQCDFAYMISPQMFDEFVRPELVAACRRLDSSFYHLDGVGQLPHLDSLLAIDELDGVQWVPGDGQKSFDGWPEVYEKIQRAGKLIQFLGTFEEFQRIVDRIGSAKGFWISQTFSASQRNAAEKWLEKFGAM